MTIWEFCDHIALTVCAAANLTWLWRLHRKIGDSDDQPR